MLPRAPASFAFRVERITGGALPAILHAMATSMPETKAVVAAEDDVPIQYMQRTRDYYLALGYGNPYRWAHFVEVPFTPLGTPLARARVALITTAAPFQPEAGDQGPGAHTMPPQVQQGVWLSTEARPISGSRTSATTAAHDGQGHQTTSRSSA